MVVVPLTNENPPSITPNPITNIPIVIELTVTFPLTFKFASVDIKFSLIVRFNNEVMVFVLVPTCIDPQLRVPVPDNGTENAISKLGSRVTELVTFRVPLTTIGIVVSDTTAPKVIDAQDTLSVEAITGVFTNAIMDPILTSSVVAGTPTGDQLAAVFQSVVAPAVPPTHDFVTAFTFPACKPNRISSNIK